MDIILNQAKTTATTTTNKQTEKQFSSRILILQGFFFFFSFFFSFFLFWKEYYASSSHHFSLPSYCSAVWRLNTVGSLPTDFHQNCMHQPISHFAFYPPIRQCVLQEGEWEVAWVTLFFFCLFLFFLFLAWQKHYIPQRVQWYCLGIHSYICTKQIGFVQRRFFRIKCYLGLIWIKLLYIKSKCM